MEVKTVNPWSHMLESCKKYGVGGITYKGKKVAELTAEESLTLIGDMFCELMVFKAEQHDKDLEQQLPRTEPGAGQIPPYHAKRADRKPNENL